MERGIKMKGTCELCNKEFNLITRHHISYFPCKTIMVCRGCHSRIHKGDLKHLCPPIRHIRIFLAKKNYMRNTHGALLRPLNKKELFLRKHFVESDTEEINQRKLKGIYYHT